MSSTDLLVWVESTSLTINRLIDEFRNTRNPTAVADAYEQSLALTGMLRALQL